MIRSFWRWFRKNEKGNVLMMTAITLPVAMVVIGVALDTMQATAAHQQLDDAADMAALAAVSQSTIQNTPGGAANTDALRAVGLAAFNAASAQVSNATVTASDVQITQLVNGVRATVTYSASVTPGITQSLLPTMPLAGTSVAEDSLPKYANFYLALDISQSMGIGATQTDMNNLMAHTPDSCAFGCHLAINSGYPSYWQIARNNNILLRIDSLRDATQQLIDTAVARTVTPNQFKIGLYTMHKGLGTLAAPTTDLTSVRSLASGIDLGTVTSGGDAQTALDQAIPALNALIPTPGTGLTPSTAMGFVFIVTDGVTDQTNGTNNHPYQLTSGGGRYYSPLDPALCTAMKSKGLTVAVLYTTYLPIPNNSWYNTYVKPYNAQTGANHLTDSLKACASSGFFFQATSDADIHTAMQTMFLTALQTVRLAS